MVDYMMSLTLTPLLSLMVMVTFEKLRAIFVIFQAFETIRVAHASNASKLLSICIKHGHAISRNATGFRCVMINIAGALKVATRFFCNDLRRKFREGHDVQLLHELIPGCGNCTVSIPVRQNRD